MTPGSSDAPWWFGVWFAFCAVLAVAWLGFLAWVIYTLVGWLVTK